MDQPNYFVVPAKENFVCKLKRSLYGLKQSQNSCTKGLIHLSLHMIIDLNMIAAFTSSLLMDHLYTCIC
jgi:hypothetical protein